jgi:hypothetical protein
VSEDVLNPGQVVDASNFLFERGVARTRPGVVRTRINGVSGVTILYGCYYLRVSKITTGPGVGILLNSDGSVYRFFAGNSYGAPNTNLITTTVLTGPAIIPNHLSNSVGIDSVSFNGIIIFTDGGASLYRWDPAGNAYTAIAGVNGYCYLTTISSRVVAGYKGGAGTNPLSIAWSASGDETNWTTLDSGNLVLQDASDAITGTGSINNVVVALRYTGIHLGTQTGVAPPVGPVFRFDPFVREGVGCYFPGTAAFTDDTGFFVGLSDVYMYDLQKITPIGRDIREKLFRYLRQRLTDFNYDVSYIGFISIDSQDRPYYDTSSNKGGVLPGRLTEHPRYRYHLVPAQNLQGNAFITAYPSGIQLPHFCYDPFEEKWSTHDYAFPIGSGFDIQGPVLVDTAKGASAATQPAVYPWDDNIVQESGAWLLGAVHTIEELEMNYKISQALLKYRDYGDSQGVKVTITVTRQDVSDGASDVQIVGTPQATLKWMRQYFNFNVVGQLIQWRIDVDPNIQFETNYLSIRYTPAGEFKQIVG